MPSMEKLFESPMCSDVTLNIGKGPIRVVVPGHSVVLIAASEWFMANHQWESSVTSSGCREIDLEANNADEIGAIHSVLRFAYSGDINTNNISDLLHIRKKAAYYLVHECVKICDEKLLTAPIDMLLEHYATPNSVWPSAEEYITLGCDFRNILRNIGVNWEGINGKPKCVLAFLNDSTLRDQIMCMPAISLATILNSIDLRSDCEDSILMLVAMWMERQVTIQRPPSRDDITIMMSCIQLNKLSLFYVCNILPYLQETYNIMDVHDWNWSLDSMYRFIFMSKMQRYRIDEYKNRDTTSHELPVMAHNMHQQQRHVSSHTIDFSFPIPTVMSDSEYPLLDNDMYAAGMIWEVKIVYMKDGTILFVMTPNIPFGLIGHGKNNVVVVSPYIAFQVQIPKTRLIIQNDNIVITNREIQWLLKDIYGAEQRIINGNIRL